MKCAKNAYYFLLGMVFTFLLTGLITPALAATMNKQIEVTTDVSVYLDDNKLNPKDASGNPVDIFVYKGTTYLPIRAVSDALNIPVYWDEHTQSVYLGNHSSTESTNLDSDILTDKAVKNGFNVSTNKVYTVGNIKFSVPEYYNDERKNDSSLILFSETGSASAMLNFSLIDNVNFSADSPDRILDSAVQGILKGLENSSISKDIQTHYSADVKVSGLPARATRVMQNIVVDGETYKCYYKIFTIASVSENQIICVTLGQTDNTQYNYFPDFEKIIESATIMSPEQSDNGVSQAEKPTSKPSVSTGSSGQTGNQSTTQNQSRTVYITPTGKCYHYNSHCNGGSYSPTTLENALKSGYVPCDKCT